MFSYNYSVRISPMKILSSMHSYNGFFLALRFLRKRFKNTFPTLIYGLGKQQVIQKYKSNKSRKNSFALLNNSGCVRAFTITVFNACKVVIYYYFEIRIESKKYHTHDSKYIFTFQVLLNAFFMQLFFDLNILFSQFFILRLCKRKLGI